MEEYKHFAYWMPSKKASENSMKFYTECIVNMPVEKNAKQTFLELYTLPGGKNRIRKLLPNIPYIFEYEGEMLTQAIFFMRGWVLKKSFFSRPPIEIIKEERRQNAVKNKKILGII